MTLHAGDRIGPYEVHAEIGAGGMGVVYRATDTNLKRAVALKVLPEAVASDPERLARFQREAEVLASLNHPNIAAIYGLERSSGMSALVMELVEGPTLAERIAISAGSVGAPRAEPGLRTDVGRVPRPVRRSLGEGGSRGEGTRGGPAEAVGLPIDETLAIARQVAEALEAAHEKGIIHRDLKPANIKITPEGQVKVLDFGLAKLIEPGSGVRDPGSGGAAGDDVATYSPTLSLGATRAGIILGTAAYMSPEQARGRTVDRRTDIFAFGCVLYEMLTGRRAFDPSTSSGSPRGSSRGDGDDVAATLARVIEREPDWSTLPAAVPPRLRELLRLCLEKNPKRRRQAAGDVRIDLEQALAEPEPAIDAGHVRLDPLGGPEATTHPRAIRRRIALASAVALALGALLAGAAVWWITRPAPPAVLRTTITTPGPTALALQGADRDIAITSDGLRVVYRGANQLLVRALNQLEPDRLGNLGAPRGPFISPDGQWVGFVDAGVLKKVAVTGGPPVTITKVDGAGPRGATWGSDGTIVYASAAPDTGLQRVSAAGGEPAVLTKADRERGEADHLWPEFLPGGEAILFTITPVGGGTDNMQVAVLDLRSGTSKVLIRGGSHTHYAPPGHLVYGVAGTLRAVAFDRGRLEVMGTPTPVLEGVVTTDTGAAQVAVAANGSLVYVQGRAGAAGQQNIIVSVDRQGRATPLPGLPLDSYRDVRVSPDGSRLALATATDVWTYHFARATLSRLTTNAAADTRPLWTPDGQRIVFSSARAGYPEIFWRPADGTGSDERLLTRAKELLDLRANSWSTDGKQLLFSELFSNFQCAIWQLAIERPSDVKVLVTSEFCNDHPVISPDGRWMAYQSTVSGRAEIYVERYPELGSRQQISTAGGQRPIWSRNGRELFFSDLGYQQILTVPVQSGTTLVAGRPQVLLDAAAVGAPGGRPYDVTPDGRFLIIRSGAAEESSSAPAELVLIQNWQEELKRLVPAN
ncbi:MAG: protein kinase domain-containing protein [Vicinamibacterales bacterium]